MKQTIRIGLIGCGFMGRAHSNAYQQVNKFFDMDIKPVLKAVCATDDGLDDFANRWGYESVESDWRKLIERNDIDLIDICAPNFLHCEIALAAAAAGKMIICEKPLARNYAEAERMAAAVEQANVANMVGFNYRRVPAITLAKEVVASGRLGKIFHYRAQYLQDWTISANLPVGGNTLWRLDKSQAGAGVCGDLLSHAIDTAEWLAGEISAVCSLSETFIRERKRHDDEGRTQKIEIDDACISLVQFESGAIGCFEATRYARGRKNFNTFEINGAQGSLYFNLENAHELQYYDHGDEASLRGWRTIRVWEAEHPYMKNWWVPGCAIGYEHTHIHSMRDFLQGIADGNKLCPDFRDGLRTQRICDMILTSAQQRKWVTIHNA